MVAIEYKILIWVFVTTGKYCLCVLDITITLFTGPILAGFRPVVFGSSFCFIINILMS